MYSSFYKLYICYYIHFRVKNFFSCPGARTCGLENRLPHLSHLPRFIRFGVRSPAYRRTGRVRTQYTIGAAYGNSRLGVAGNPAGTEYAAPQRCRVRTAMQGLTRGPAFFKKSFTFAMLSFLCFQNLLVP